MKGFRVTYMSYEVEEHSVEEWKSEYIIWKQYIRGRWRRYTEYFHNVSTRWFSNKKEALNFVNNKEEYAKFFGQDFELLIKQRPA